MKINSLFSILALTFVVVNLSACGFTVIDPGNRGVKVSMGVMDKQLKEPGVQIFNPFTDNVREYSCKQETTEGKCSPLTSDQQSIEVSYKVLAKIPEDKVLTLFSQYSGDPYTSLVDPQIQEAFRQVVSQYKADAATKNIDTIKNQVLEHVKVSLKGLVEVNDIALTHVELPKVLQDAIADKQVMEQASLKKQYELDKAKKEAEITVTNAQANAEAQLVAARAEAKAIEVKTEALAKSPQLIEYTKAQKWSGNLPTTVVGDSSKLFFNVGGK